MAVGFVNTNTPLVQFPSTTTLSGAQTATNTGTNLCAVAFIGWNDEFAGLDVSTVTYGGAAMTAWGAKVMVGSSGNLFLRAYGLVAPATGSNTLSITFTGACINRAAVLSVYNGVDPTTPIRSGTYTTLSGNTSGAGLASLVVTSATGDRTLTCATSTGAASMTTNQTLREHDNGFGSCIEGLDDAAGATSVTHTWDQHNAAASPIAVVGASLQAAATTTPVAQTLATIWETSSATLSTLGRTDPLIVPAHLQMPLMGGIYV